MHSEPQQAYCLQLEFADSTSVGVLVCDICRLVGLSFGGLFSFFIIFFLKEICAFMSLSYLNAECYFVIYKLVASEGLCTFDCSVSPRAGLQDQAK